jgi:hypothetical protein
MVRAIDLSSMQLIARASDEISVRPSIKMAPIPGSKLARQWNGESAFFFSDDRQSLENTLDALLRSMH